MYVLFLQEIVVARLLHLLGRDEVDNKQITEVKIGDIVR